MSDVGTNNAGFSGQQQLTDDTSSFNMQTFLIKQFLGKLSIATQVSVIAVDTVNLRVDVQPLVNLIDGQGNASPRGQVFNLPYIRLQGGVNGIILDPAVGDIGLVVTCDRDISSVKANAAQSNPGSLRRFDIADGIYIGGDLNARPTNYVQFGDGFITLSPDNGTTYIKIEAGKITLFAAEVVAHATTKYTFDADGTGAVYQPGQIDTYTDGVPSSHHAPNPPGPLA